MRFMATAVAAALVASALTPQAAMAGANGFTLVNATGKALTGIALRRTGSSDWRAIGGGASPGASTAIGFSDPDCAFDLQASAGGSTAVWRGVNLCEVKSVTLHLDASGATWAEYD